MNISHHLASQLAAERQRDLRSPNAGRASVNDAAGTRGSRLAHPRFPRSAAAWRARFRHGRSA